MRFVTGRGTQVLRLTGKKYRIHLLILSQNLIPNGVPTMAGWVLL